MTLGELSDQLKELAQVEKEVEEAKRSLGHGGCEATMVSKRECLRDREEWLTCVRERELEL